MNLSKIFQPRCKHRHTFSEHRSCFNSDGSVKTEVQVEEEKQIPPVLILDIETSLSEAYVWGPGEQYVAPHQIKKDWFVLGWSAKYLFSDEVISAIVTPEEAKNCNDERVVRWVWKLLNSASIVIGHNITGFDIPKLNARFLYYGLNPPMFYQTIDTLSVARRVFKFSSNKLDEVTKLLGLGSKGHPGYDCWIACSNGNAESLKSMQSYNENDSVIEEELYLKVRPWIKSHPNMALYIQTDEPICSICGNKDLNWHGFYPGTTTGVYKTFRCNKCGAVGRSRTNELTKEQRANLTRSK